jgi:hypothetical protein
MHQKQVWEIKRIRLNENKFDKYSQIMALRRMLLNE